MRFTKVLLAALAATLAAGCEEDIPCVPGPGVACTFMGTGFAGLGEDDLPLRETELYLPQDVTVGHDGTIYVVDWNNHRIRSVEGDIATTVVGTGYLGDAPAGIATDVSLNHPTHITLKPDGKVIIAAWHNSKILEYDPSSGHVEPICGTGARSYEGDGGPAVTAVLDLPVATALAPDGGIYIADQANQRIRKIDASGIIQTVVGDGVPGDEGDGGPASEARIRLPGGQAAPPAGRIATDAHGNLYIADSGNHKIRKVDHHGNISTLAGTGAPGRQGDGGPALHAQLFRPSDVEVDGAGNVYIADTDNSCIRRVDSTGTMTTVVGICGSPGLGHDGAPPETMLLDRPYGLGLGDDGMLYVADTHNHRIVALALE
jgi:hypothetical protein